ASWSPCSLPISKAPLSGTLGICALRIGCCCTFRHRTNCPSRKTRIELLESRPLSVPPSLWVSLFSPCAEVCPTPAFSCGNGRSEARAEAIPSQLQTLVRQFLGVILLCAAVTIVRMRRHFLSTACQPAILQYRYPHRA